MNQNPNQNPNPNPEIHIKLIVIGDSMVGKTSLVNTYIYGRPELHHFSTIGIDYHCKRINHPDFNINLHIWDTAGQEKFRTVVNSFYRGSDAVIIVFDKGNQKSFDNVTEWIKDINDKTTNASIIIVGNKCDKYIEDIRYKIDPLLLEYDNSQYLETSVLENTNIKELFENIVNTCIKKNAYRLSVKQSSIYLREDSDAKYTSCCNRF